MTNVLIYWRDYRRNVQSTEDAATPMRWHSNAGLLSGLVAGDRLWMVTSGAAAGESPAAAGFLVDVWTVNEVIPNPGDDPNYPREHYRTRITCSRLSRGPGTPINIDSLLRPESRPSDLSIGRYLQGPRRLSDERLHALEQSLLNGTTTLQDDSPVTQMAKHPAPRMQSQNSSLLPRKRVPSSPDLGNESASIDSWTADGVDIDRDIVALGIRQPWAELILQGIKTVEVRTLETNHRGPIYLYASKTLADTPAALAAIDRYQLDVAALPTGFLVGSVEITGCRESTGDDETAACLPASSLRKKRAWLVSNPKRLKVPLRPRFLPYGVWFYPFRRKNGADSS